MPIAANAADTDSNTHVDTDKGTDSDSDSETTSDKDGEPSNETIMYFPMEIDDNPYAKKIAPPPKAEGAEKAVKSPAPISEKTNPPWVETPPPAEALSGSESDEAEAGVTYLPPPPPPPPSVVPLIENPCTQVTCSARGACVLKNNEPTCACFQGFIPDSVNGLSCIAEASTTAPPAWDIDTYYAAMNIALGEYDIDSRLQAYQAETARGEIKGSFADYLRRSFKRTQNFGTIAMSFGIAAFAGGLSMHMLYAGYPDKGGLLAGAIILDLTGAGLIGTGAAMLTLASKRTKQLEKFEKSNPLQSARVVWLPPQMQFGQDAASLTLGLLFF